MSVIIRKDHIPFTTAANKRPGVKMTPQSVTIHNTGNPESSAANERNNLVRPDNTRTASFHYVIDEHEIVECIPPTEIAWHAGDNTKKDGGNMTSIGIEICESGNYQKTLTKAAEFVADILFKRGWDTTKMKRHYDWSEKICPRLMYDGGTWAGWFKFKNLVNVELIRLQQIANPPIKNKDWKDVGFDYMVMTCGIDAASWSKTSPIDMGTLGTLLQRWAKANEKK